MKNKKKTLLASLLALLLLTGCANTQSTATAEQEKEAAIALAEGYLAHIATLEATLQSEREERYISESQYEQRIRELEETLKQLSDAVNGEGDGAAELVFHYRVENGAATVIGYEGEHPFVTVPTTLDGYPVRAIGERAFENKSISAVVLPEGLVTIEWFAFYGCSALVDVTIPASVQSIGHAVFDGCPDVSVVCAKGSFAEEYAKSYGLSCVVR